MRSRLFIETQRRGASMRCLCALSLAPATLTSRFRGAPRIVHLSSLLQRRHSVLTSSVSTHLTSHLAFSVRHTSSWAVPSSIFVRFQPTPNDACYKFYVDEMTFLPPGTHTMMFDSTNSYQSALAHTLLEALPMVEEVTVGPTFVTVRRVEDADAKAAARLFAMKFHGARSGQEMDTAAAAARSHALQQRVDDARDEGEGVVSSSPPASAAGASPSSSGFAAEEPIELGGFTVSPSAQDEEIDESAIEALIAATDWLELKFHVSALLTDHISSGSPHVDPNAPNPHADTVPEEGDSEVVLMIKELVATTIRPQLQDDGGDLRFVAFDVDGGEMQVELLGACRTCKSSKTTLVDLIERTTRHWIPEVKAVKDVSRLVSPSQRFAEEAMSEGESGPSVAELLQDMEAHPADSDASEDATQTTQKVQFPAGDAAALKDIADGGYRVVREIKASAREQLDGTKATSTSAAASL